MNTKKILFLSVIFSLLCFTQFSYGDDDNEVSHKAMRIYPAKVQKVHYSKFRNNETVYVYTENEYTEDLSPMDENTAYAAESEYGAASLEVTGVRATAKVSLYPLYDKEYFYRDNYNEPIRDFRSYDIKTVTPEPEYYGYKTGYYGVLKHTQPIRDFRDYWNNE